MLRGHDVGWLVAAVVRCADVGVSDVSVEEAPRRQ